MFTKAYLQWPRYRINRSVHEEWLDKNVTQAGISSALNKNEILSSATDERQILRALC